jgi:four helix bundle protein
VADTLSLKDLFSRGHAALIDQFHSASISVVLNIAEGAGKFKTADKQRFYAIDRGSAMECGALLDIFSLLKIIDKKQHCSQKDTLVRIVSMLTSLCLSRRQ